MPNGENLRALINALEAFLGFRNCFDGSDPEFSRTRGVKSDTHALPAVLHAKQRTGQYAAEAKTLAAFGSFEKTVCFGRGEKIEDGFDADGNGLCERTLEF